MTVENSSSKKRNENGLKYILTDSDSVYIIIFIVILFVFQTLIVALISSFY